MKTARVEVKGQKALETFLSIGKATAKFVGICHMKYDSINDRMVIKLRTESDKKKYKLVIQGVSRNKDVKEIVFKMRDEFLKDKEEAKRKRAAENQKKEEGS